MYPLQRFNTSMTINQILSYNLQATQTKTPTGKYLFRLHQCFALGTIGCFVLKEVGL